MAINEKNRINNLLAGAYYSRYLESKLMYRNNKPKPTKVTTKHKTNGIQHNGQSNW